jgi:hypothetical protein
VNSTTIIELRQQSPCMTNASHEIIKTLCALPKGAETEKIRAGMRQVIENEGLSDYESIYIDGSLKEHEVGCEVVLPTATLKYQNNYLQCRNVWDLESH